MPASATASPTATVTDSGRDRATATAHDCRQAPRFDPHLREVYNPVVTETRPRHTRARLAVVRLLVISAFSLAAAWGRKPPKKEEVKVTLRPISAREVIGILHRFPELVPDYLAHKKDDTSYLARIFGFSEVTAAPLKRAFRAARFYLGHDFSKPPNPYLMTISEEKCHGMPEGFNRLLFDNGIKVTDKNMLALAKALTILTVEGEYGPYPQIAFRDVTKIDTMISRITWGAKLTVEFGKRVEVWHFARWHDGFGVVSRGTEEGKLITQYDLLQAQPSPKR